MFFTHIYRTAVIYSFLDPDSFVVYIVSTDVATNAIQSTILHFLLCFPIATGIFVSLQPNNASEFQNCFRTLKYFVVDEKSIIGFRLLANVDFRLRQTFSYSSSEVFGNINVILINDFYQLPLMKQRPFYYLGELCNVIEIAGCNAYMALDCTIELKTVQRQRGLEEQAFRNALDGLRVNRPNV